MERWVPLLRIFLHSPSPEGEASLWFQNQNQNHHHYSSFLSLLLSPTSALLLKAPVTSSSSPQPYKLTWIQTLPPALQSRILSFLAIENHRFCRRRLCSLAAHILGSNTPSSPDFWVRKAALNLLDAVSSSDPTPFEPLLPEEQDQHQQQASKEEEEEFYALPQWLKDSASSSIPLLPWLPLSHGPSPKTACRAFGISSDKKQETIDLVTEQEDQQQQARQHCNPESSSFSASPLPPLDPQIHNQASSLKADLLASYVGSHTTGL